MNKQTKKKCYKCGKVLSLSKFYKRETSTTTHDHMCKACRDGYFADNKSRRNSNHVRINTFKGLNLTLLPNRDERIALLMKAKQIAVNSIMQKRNRLKQEEFNLYDKLTL